MMSCTYDWKVKIASVPFANRKKLNESRENTFFVSSFIHVCHKNVELTKKTWSWIFVLLVQIVACDVNKKCWHETKKLFIPIQSTILWVWISCIRTFLHTKLIIINQVALFIAQLPSSYVHFTGSVISLG